MLRKAVETDEKYYIFMEYCNGSDIKTLMDAKDWDLAPSIIHKIMQ